jgi:hypothetical protein
MRVPLDIRDIKPENSISAGFESIEDGERDRHSTLRKKLWRLQRVIEVDNEELSGRVNQGAFSG